MVVMMDNNSRRRGWVVVDGVRVAAMVMVVVMVVALGLMGESDLTDLGVISVGEAMVL